VSHKQKRKEIESMFIMSCSLPSQLSPPRKSKTVPKERLSKEGRRRKGNGIKDGKGGGGVKHGYIK
jgi:hypothetical protein